MASASVRIRLHRASTRSLNNTPGQYESRPVGVTGTTGKTSSTKRR